jgi:hypothetical protein
LERGDANFIAIQRRRLCVHPEDDYSGISSYYMLHIHIHPQFCKHFPSFAELLRVIPTLEVTRMDWILFEVCDDSNTARIFKSISWILGFFQELKRVHLVQSKLTERFRGGRSYELKSKRGKIKILDAFRSVFEQKHEENPNVRIPQIKPYSSSESFAKTIM